MALKSYKCENCSAITQIDIDADKKYCPYCRTKLTEQMGENAVPSTLAMQQTAQIAEAQKAQDSKESLEFVKNIKPSTYNKANALRNEKIKVFAFKFIFYPLAFLFFFGAVLMFFAFEGEFEFEDNPFFWILGIIGLVIFLIPFGMKATSTFKRMENQLKCDGFDIKSYFYIVSSQTGNTSFFIISNKNSWIVWEESGDYIYHSKFEVSKCEEVVQEYKDDLGNNLCHVYKLILYFIDERPNFEVHLITPNKPINKSFDDYKRVLDRAKSIKKFFDC